MKRILLVFCLVLFAWTVPAQAARSCSAPPDTVAGEARLTALFARGICEQIAMQSRHQDLAVLTKAQGMELLNEVLTAAIIRDSTAFRSFLAHVPDTTAAMQRVSMQAVLRLSSACPVAGKLLTQMGVQMAGFDTNLTAGQQQVLQTVAQDLCGRLTAADAQLAFSHRTAPERIAAYHSARHEIIMTHGSALVAAFGEQLVNNKQLESTMWQNVDRLMFDICPALTGQLRADRGSAQLQEAATVPTPSPGAAAKKMATPVTRHGHKK